MFPHLTRFLGRRVRIRVMQERASAPPAVTALPATSPRILASTCAKRTERKPKAAPAASSLPSLWAEGTRARRRAGLIDLSLFCSFARLQAKFHGAAEAAESARPTSTPSVAGRARPRVDAAKLPPTLLARLASLRWLLAHNLTALPRRPSRANGRPPTAGRTEPTMSVPGCGVDNRRVGVLPGC